MHVTERGWFVFTSTDAHNWQASWLLAVCLLSECTADHIVDGAETHIQLV